MNDTQVAALDLASFMRGASGLLNDLAAAQAMISSSPEVLGGTPVIRGTRISVHNIAASLAAGYTTDRILEVWPSLDVETIRLAALYAEANPLRGRPRTASDLPDGAVIITDRLVPRCGKVG